MGASVLPVYGVFLMPEIFNFTIVTARVLPLALQGGRAGVAPRRARGPTIAAAVLLGLGTYSKPLPTAILVAPLVAAGLDPAPLGARVRRRARLPSPLRALCFGLNAAISGEFNYQGGDRKTFYGSFPFDAPDGPPPGSARGGSREHRHVDAAGSAQLERSCRCASRTTSEYFLVGRHFGFVPYFFPGVVAHRGLAAVATARRDSWRLLTFGAVFASAVGPADPAAVDLERRRRAAGQPLLLHRLPGAAVPGSAGRLDRAGRACLDRRRAVHGEDCWSTRSSPRSSPICSVEKGPARRLPVELTMANDLPVRLAQPLRGHVQYRTDPGVLLYFLDQNSWPPEPNGMWISGAGRSDIIVRAAFPIEYMQFEAESPMPTVLTIALGSAPVTVCAANRARSAASTCQRRACAGSAITTTC